MCIYAYLCVSMCVYLCIHIDSNIYIYIYIERERERINIYIYTYIYIYSNAYVYIHIYIYIYTHTYTYTYTYIYIYIYIYMNLCIHSMLGSRRKKKSAGGPPRAFSATWSGLSASKGIRRHLQTRRVFEGYSKGIRRVFEGYSKGIRRHLFASLSGSIARLTSPFETRRIARPLGCLGDYLPSSSGYDLRP